ncbi:Co2+/Mg2+ efflux protein ApaG [Catenovulum sp. 2E275]|uniref:Co2+/Mg2+ efflux protein ApaG n=1 Tax=Catenovulum sp. 2E275 TaxID=2980497 RepID=UPI0021D026F0|nr:Co2+/Mg2+ efflux protein ApaG [Catenovulum sp. 2E275]MCU4675086.1 Co2+/Mg2+ efflux protein ApaG [Catenovulum sp. 2E275]
MINPQDAIQIQTETYYVDEQSDPKEDRYVFAYTITIHNKGNQAVQLKSRYWLITDSNGKKVEVQGDGVIGQQPVIKPNGKFQYTSGAVVDTPVATMEGHYDMIEVENEQSFKAPINVFRLAQPNILN